MTDSPPAEWFHCLRCDTDVPASEVTEREWMPGRIGTFHSCGDYANPAWYPHANTPGLRIHCEVEHDLNPESSLGGLDLVAWHQKDHTVINDHDEDET